MDYNSSIVILTCLMKQLLGSLSFLLLFSSTIPTAYAQYPAEIVEYFRGTQFPMPPIFIQDSSVDCPIRANVYDTECNRRHGKLSNYTLNSQQITVDRGHSLKIKWYPLDKDISLKKSSLEKEKNNDLEKIAAHYDEYMSGVRSIEQEELYALSFHFDEIDSVRHFYTHAYPEFILDNDGKKRGVGYFSLNTISYPWDRSNGGIDYNIIIKSPDCTSIAFISYDLEPEHAITSSWNTYVNEQPNVDNRMLNDKNETAYMSISKSILQKYLDNYILQDVISMEPISLLKKSVSAVFTTDFQDVPTIHRYFDAITRLYKERVLSGYSGRTFKPEQEISRAEFTKILVSSFYNANFQQWKYLKKACFSDVQDSEWYAPFVCYAQEKHIVSGYANDTFRPTHYITVAESIKMLLEAKHISVNSEATTPWYLSHMRYAEDLKILSKISPLPLHFLTRGEAAALMVNGKNNM